MTLTSPEANDRSHGCKPVFAYRYSYATTPYTILTPKFQDVATLDYARRGNGLCVAVDKEQRVAALSIFETVRVCFARHRSVLPPSLVPLVLRKGAFTCRANPAAAQRSCRGEGLERLFLESGLTQNSRRSASSAAHSGRPRLGSISRSRRVNFLVHVASPSAQRTTTSAATTIPRLMRSSSSFTRSAAVAADEIKRSAA
jgi:hypothetical protein